MKTFINVLAAAVLLSSGAAMAETSSSAAAKVTPPAEHKETKPKAPPTVTVTENIPPAKVEEKKESVRQNKSRG